MEPSSNTVSVRRSAARPHRPGQSCNERFSLPQHGYRHTGDLMLLHQLTNMLTDAVFNAASLAIGLTVAASTDRHCPKYN